MTHRLIAVGCGIALLAGGALAQGGHRIGANAVVIDGPSHWNNWSFPSGTLKIDADGVRPRHWRKDTNAVLDIVDNLRFNPPDYLNTKAAEEIELLDALDAGTNVEDLVHLFDGDITTYWEPEFPRVGATDDLDQRWWFAVDMGHSLNASRIVLRFVNEDLGDPFRLFEVLVSDGQKPVQALTGNNLEYTRVYQTLHPNLSERVIEIDLANVPVEQRRKRIVRRVQVVVTGSSLDRGREISQAEYEQMRQDAPRDTGLVEYARRLSSGGDIAVTPAVYARLDENRRGSVRYFRRELPRLAELEVWSDGDDIFKETLARGGGFTHATTHPLGAADMNPKALLDGAISTSVGFRIGVRGLSASFLVDLIVDLGSSFWIEGGRMALNFRSVLEPSTFGEFAFDFSDGRREIDGSLKWDRRVYTDGAPERSPTSGLVHLYCMNFEPVKARFFRLQYRRADHQPQFVAVGDMQLIGRGYQPQIELTSDLIQLGASRNLTTIEWDADTPPDTRVQLQTRTGNTLDTLLHYYKTNGTEVSAAQYNQIRIKSQKGDIIPEEVASSDWEPWSEPYEVSGGSQITSPSPRQFLKIRATLLADDPGLHATLRAVRLNFSEPVADRLQGRLVPTRVDSLGVERGFSLLVDFESLGHPFDEILLRAPAGMQLSFDPVCETMFAGLASAFEIGADPSGQALRDVQVLATGDSLHLSFPQISSGVEVVRLDFRGTLFSGGGRLQALVRDSEDGHWQQVDEQVNRTSLQLVAQPHRKRLFGALEVNPPAFSPNGDGINDVMLLDFALMLVGASTAVEVEIFDLSGSRVRRLEEQRQVSAGAYSIPWDGRDEAGDLVSPGLYALRLRLDSDTEGASVREREIVRTVAVIY